MEFFDLFLAAAILAAVAMIGFTVWTVMKNRVKTPPATSAAASVPNAANAGRVDWRVYAIDRDGNCFTGSDIVLNREEDVFDRLSGKRSLQEHPRTVFFSAVPASDRAGHIARRAACPVGDPILPAGLLQQVDSPGFRGCRLIALFNHGTDGK